MNTNDIMAVRKVCETGSIGKAAAQLYMTPQALSVVIKRVENELGVSLFKRASGGMILNDYGKAFLEKSEDLIADLREMEEMFHLELENRHGVLKVGFSQGIIVMMGIDYILSFTKKYPNFRMEIIEGPDKKIEDLVRTGAVDIGIMAAPTISSDFDSKPWCHFKCCAMMSTESEECKKIGEREVISIFDLREHPIVLENKDFSIYREFNRICRENYDFEPEIFFETVEIDNALAIASKGYATAIVPVPVAENSKYHDLHTAELEEDLFWDWIFVKKKGSSVKEIEHAFIDHLTRKSKEMGWI